MRLSLKNFILREGDVILWTIEFLSGVSLLLYALMSGYAEHQPQIGSPHTDHVFSHLMRPSYWITVLTFIGVSQLVCSVRRNPLCTVLTAYPASAACMFAGVYGCIIAHAIVPVAVFAIAWGILNYAVVKHSWTKAKGSSGG